MKAEPEGEQRCFSDRQFERQGSAVLVVHHLTGALEKSAERKYVSPEAQ